MDKETIEQLYTDSLATSIAYMHRIVQKGKEENHKMVESEALIEGVRCLTDSQYVQIIECAELPQLDPGNSRTWTGIDELVKCRSKCEKKYPEDVMSEVISDSKQMLEHYDLPELDDQQITRLLTAAMAYNAVEAEYTETFEPEVPIEGAPGLLWIAKSPTEFIQFAYSLILSSRAKHTADSRRRFVEDLAKVFQFDLGKNWYQLLTDSVHGTQDDYVPEIFDDLKSSFLDYRKKKRNK